MASSSHILAFKYGDYYFTFLILCSSYHVSEVGLWWQELASDLNTPKDIYCSPKEEKDATVFSVRVCTTTLRTSCLSSFHRFPEIIIMQIFSFTARMFCFEIPSLKRSVMY
jgi:hypothetical protein